MNNLYPCSCHSSGTASIMFHVLTTCSKLIRRKWKWLGHADNKWWHRWQTSTRVDIAKLWSKRAIKNMGKRSRERNVDSKFQAQLNESGGGSMILRRSWMETSGLWVITSVAMVTSLWATMQGKSTAHSHWCDVQSWGNLWWQFVQMQYTWLSLQANTPTMLQRDKETMASSFFYAAVPLFTFCTSCKPDWQAET